MLSRTKCTLAILIAALSFNLLPSISMADENTSLPPQITGFDVSPRIFSAVSTDKLLTVSMDITDDSGICSKSDDCKNVDKPIGLTLINANTGKTIEASDFKRISGDDKNGTYAASMLFPKGSPVGKWIVSDVRVKNDAGNSIHFDNIKNFLHAVPQATGTIVMNKVFSSNKNTASTTDTDSDSADKSLAESSPAVTAGNIDVDGNYGDNDEFTISDEAYVTWNNSSSGDNNSGITSVNVDFSQFGGGIVAAYDDGISCDDDAGDNIWTACYDIHPGSINGVSGKYVSVSATNSSGTKATADDTAFTIDNVAPANPTVLSFTNPVSSSNQENVMVAGTTDPNSEVDCWIDDQNYNFDAYDDVTSNGSGAYSCGPMDVSDLDEGLLNLEVTSYDTAGNESVTTTKTLTKDAFAGPRIRFTEDVDGPDSYYYINIDVDGQAGNGDSHYGFSGDDTCNSSDTFPNAFTSNDSFHISDASHNGKYICARYIDSDNSTIYAASNAPLAFDDTPPNNPTIATVTDPITASNQTNVMTTGTADPNTDIYCEFYEGDYDGGYGEDYTWDTATSDSSGHYSCGPANVTDAPDGTLTVKVWAEDAAGNYSDDVYKTTTKNTTPADPTHTPIYRLYNTKNGAFLYAKGDSDRDYVLNKFHDFEFTDGIPAYYASLTAQSGLTPIYRLYNTKNGAFLYTKGESDRDYVLNKFSDFEFTDGAPAFYASLTSQDGLTPIYRLYNRVTGMFLYSRGAPDRDYVLNKWSDFEFTDGVPAFYATLN